VSPQVDDGTVASWHVEKIAGGDVVYTCPPPYLEQIMQVQDRFRPFDPEAIHEPPPKAAMDKLLRIPYFIQAYEPEGMVLEQFNRFAPLIATMAEFSAATRKTVDFVARQFQELGGFYHPENDVSTLPEKSQRMLLARNIHS
jgi:transaldolase